VDGGNVITISGTNFITATGVEVSVTFGGIPAPSVSHDSETEIKAVTPPGTSGAVDVIVTVAGGSATVEDGFTYVGRPVIESLNVISGTVRGGTLLVLTGIHFNNPPLTKVTFGGVEATVVADSLAETTVSVETPPGEAGKVNVSVFNNDGNDTLQDGYYYTADYSAGIKSVTPDFGTVDGGDTVVIMGNDGANFDNPNVESVTYGGVPVQSFTVDSSTKLTVLTDAHSSGVVDVTVSTSLHGGSSTTLEKAFSYKGIPEIMMIAPDWCLTDGGSEVTITGNHFANPAVTKVTFGNTEATGLNIVDDEKLTAITPPGSPGEVDVVVENPDGFSTLEDSFTFVPPAVAVASASPTEAEVFDMITFSASGSSHPDFLTLYEWDFESDGVFDISNTDGTDVAHAYNCPKVFTATLRVTDNYGQTATDTVDITVTAPPPSIASILPDRGTPAGGTFVTITGENFFSGATVTIGGNDATQIKVVSTSQLTAVTPAGSIGKKDVVVTNTDGQFAKLVGGFEYVKAAIITEPVARACLRGEVSVRGTVNAGVNGLRSWTLYVASGAPPTGSYVELKSGTNEIPEEAELTPWNTLAEDETERPVYPDGAYTLLLQVTDNGGNVDTDKVVVKVDNTPPKLNIHLASEGAVGDYTKDYTLITVSGAIEDTCLPIQLLSAKLRVQANAPFDDVTDKVGIDSNGTISGTLEGFDLSEVTELKLMLKGEDGAGNQNEGVSNILIVDNESPTVQILNPANLANFNYCPIQIEGTAADASSGVAKVELDTTGGEVFSPDVEVSVSQDDIVSWTFPFNPDPNAVYTILARSIDNAGNQSTVASIQVKHFITSPTANISAPVDGSRVCGIVKILGSADDSDRDYSDLSWSVGWAPGADAQEAWVIIKEVKSPHATRIIDSLLAEWDTSNLIKTQFYTLFLTVRNDDVPLGTTVKRNIIIVDMPAPIIGDVSGDCNITAYDASLVLKSVVGLVTLTAEQQIAADVTGDKSISALDAALILQYSVGIITRFPAQDATFRHK